DNLKFSWTSIYEDQNGKQFEWAPSPNLLLPPDPEKNKLVGGRSEAIEEVQRGFFGTLYNTYSFFALYANIDKFVFDEKNVVPVSERTELDRWLISRLNSLVKLVTERLDDYDPTPASRAIDSFVDEH